MTGREATPADTADGPTLVFDRSDGALERLLHDASGPLVVVACDGRSEQLLRRTSRSDLGTDLDIFEVGTRMRSAAIDGSTGSGHRPVVTGVPREELHGLGSLVDDALADGTGDGTIYVDGEGSIATIGVGETYGVFERLGRRHRPDGPTVFGCLPVSARATTVAGLEPLFDAVATVGDGGDLQPSDRPADGETLSIDRCLGLLKKQRRRTLLRVLDARDGRIDVDRLAEAVEARLAEPPTDLRLLFYQSDLPKLADHGVVDFDREDRTATLTPAALQLWPILEATDRRTRPTRL